MVWTGPIFAIICKLEAEFEILHCSGQVDAILLPSLEKLLRKHKLNKKIIFHSLPLYFLESL